MQSLPCNADIRHIERHCERYSVQRITKELPELPLIYVARSQNGFADILSRAQIVIVIGKRAAVVANVDSRTGRLLLAGGRSHGVLPSAARGSVEAVHGDCPH